MSWDLYLVPREHAEDPGEWIVEELRHVFAEGHETGVGLVNELVLEESPRRRRFCGLF